TESGTPEAGQNKSPQAIQPKRNDVVSSDEGLNKTRSKLAIELLALSKWLVVGIGVLVLLDFASSKFIAWRLIEKLIEPTAPVSSQQTGASSQTSANPAPPSSNSPDKSSDAAQRLIVYKDLLKEASLNKELLTLLLTSQTALVSGALGFYFGGKDNN
ncbi:MAG: hypothetical protein ACK5XR_13630, partial [Pseudanabaena sp.]